MLFPEIIKEYKSERKYFIHRVEITEELAGVGLSVETASHDLMSMAGKIESNVNHLIEDLMSTDEIDKDKVLKDLKYIREGLDFIKSNIRNIQPLFVSTTQRKRSIKLEDVVVKIEQIYSRTLKREAIHSSISSVGDPPHS